MNSIYSELLHSLNANMASGSRSVGYHSAVRGPGPPALHPSNEPGPQTLIPAMLSARSERQVDRPSPQSNLSPERAGEGGFFLLRLRNCRTKLLSRSVFSVAHPMLSLCGGAKGVPASLRSGLFLLTRSPAAVDADRTSLSLGADPRPEVWQASLATTRIKTRIRTRRSD